RRSSNYLKRKNSTGCVGLFVHPIPASSLRSRKLKQRTSPINSHSSLVSVVHCSQKSQTRQPPKKIEKNSTRSSRGSLRPTSELRRPSLKLPKRFQMIA